LLLAIHLVMTADIEQNDFFFRNLQGENYSITVGGHGIKAFKLAAERVQVQVWLKRVLDKVIGNCGKGRLEILVLSEKFSGPP
jgi:hypothetical protein